MPFTQFVENKMLGHELGSGAGFAAQSAFVSLHTANPTDAGLAEITGASSWRTTAPNNTTTWSATGRSAWNLVTLTFPTPNGNFGTASAFGIWDNVSAGNLRGYGWLSTASAIASGNTVSFPAASIIINLSGM